MRRWRGRGWGDEEMREDTRYTQTERQRQT